MKSNVKHDFNIFFRHIITYNQHDILKKYIIFLIEFKIITWYIYNLDQFTKFFKADSETHETCLFLCFKNVFEKI